MLLIDDEEALLHILTRGLRRHYDILAARTALDAERLVQEHRDEIDLVVCDVTMPDVNGVVLYDKLVSIVPDLAERFAFMTGGGLCPPLLAAMNRTRCPILEKPVDVPKLASYIAHQVTSKRRPP